MNSELRTLVSRRALHREVTHFARMAEISEGTADHALWCQIRDELRGYIAATNPDSTPAADQGALFASPATPVGGRDPCPLPRSQ